MARRSPILLGGWAAPWGIEYRIDALNALVLVIVTGASTVSLVHARLSVAREVRRERIGLLYTAWLLCLTGMLGMTITGDAFNVFVFLEIASLSSYVLVALGPGRAALLAAFRYLVLGSIGATFFLIGIGLLYMMTGTLNMADLSARLGDAAHTRTVAAGVVFVVLGIGLKAAVFPLHAWLPGAYAHAPTSVASFFAGTATKVSIYVLARFLFGVFGVDLAFERLGLGVFLIPLAIAGVLAGSAVAVFQDHAKRLLAWSSIAQIGYMVLGLGLGTVGGVTASVVHLFNHALMKVALFLAIGEPRLPHRVVRTREPRGARQEHAVDDGRVRGRRDEPSSAFPSPPASCRSGICSAPLWRTGCGRSRSSSWCRRCSPRSTCGGW